MPRQVEAIFPHRYNKVDYEQGQVYEIEDEHYPVFIGYALIKDVSKIEEPTKAKRK